MTTAFEGGSGVPADTHEVVTLRSGSLAMRNKANGEVMHPGTGPQVEPRVLYIEPSRLQARLEEQIEAPLVLFDVGLGAASNAVAAWNVAEALGPSARRLHIVSFENDLGSLRLALEHPAAFGLESEAAQAAARALLREGTFETPRTRWELRVGDVQAELGRVAGVKADLVYWDMYSPLHAPELWSSGHFAALHRHCALGATLHTYSNATAARAALLLAGFFVGTGIETGFKEQTTMAATTLASLVNPLGARWLERLHRSSSPFPVDVPKDEAGRAQAFAAIHAHPQFAAPVTR